MDFDDTPQEARFRAEAWAWLSHHARLKGSEPTIPAPINDAESELLHLQESKAWQRTLHEGGWAGITWPIEFGGRGGTPVQAMIFAQEQARFEVPSSVFTQGIGMAGPTIMTHGTTEQQHRFLHPMLRGEEVWCQLFSEPGAGSDLASLSTTAVRAGDEFVVNGQKVWTSSAHFSDWGILLARTNMNAPKHRGITFFLVDMRTAGVEIRPIRQATGASHFNEVFLTDVRIPADNVVGPVDEGWRVTMTTLSNERMAIGGGAQSNDQFGHLARLAEAQDLAGDGTTRQDLARAYVRIQLLKYLGWRVQTSVSKGEPPGPQSSVLKLALSEHLGLTADLIMSLLGPKGTLLDYSDPSGSRWQLEFVGQWSARLGGGTEQIQRNVIAERVLGLPREPRLDRDTPCAHAYRTVGAT